MRAGSYIREGRRFSVLETNTVTFQRASQHRRPPHLLTREPPASMSTSRRVPLSTAAAYEELSPLGSAQLERNAIHFFGTLTRDQAVVEEINLKVKSSYDSMPNGWSRLRAHSEESRGTICSYLSVPSLHLFRPALCSLLFGLLVSSGIHSIYATSL